VATLHPALVSGSASAKPIWCLESGTWAKAPLPAPVRSFAEAAGFRPEPGKHLIVRAKDGAVTGVLFGIDPPSGRAADPFLPGRSR
jgi:hypothetical protein